MNKEIQNKDIKNFLLIGKIEGYSYLALLFVAMPLRSLFEMHLAVKYAGYIHGILFLMFLYQLIKLQSDKLINLKQAAISFILSLIPFGTFFLHKVVESNKTEG